MIAYYMEKPNKPAQSITDVEDFMVKNNLECLMPTIEDLWSLLRSYDTPPHFFNCYAYLLFNNFINFLVCEYDLKETDFDYSINGELDTDLYYKNEHIFDILESKLMLKK